MTSLTLIDYAPLVVHFGRTLDLTDEQFFEFCRINRDLRIERSADGSIIVMTPAGGRTGARNAKIAMQLGQWAERDGRGVVFDSSTGFRLSNGAVRAPDAAWILRSRLSAVPEELKDRFLPVCPDFVVELRSPTDELAALQAKMEEYRTNGARLGWLIDAESRCIHVYAQDAAPRQVTGATELSGDPVLPGFVLHLVPIWQPTL